MHLRALGAALAALCLPESSLSVWTGTDWEVWWTSDAAPPVWSSPAPALVSRLRWRAVAPGVAWTDVRIAGRNDRSRTRLIVVRLDPRRVRFALDTAYRDGGRRPGWSIERAPRDALVALNAGQFQYLMPWGWVVLNGRQYLPPGRGPLSVAVAFDTGGAVRWLAPDAIGDPRRAGIASAFQSYPRLLDDGVIPPALRDTGAGVDLEHRDARLGFGQAWDGSILIAMTRFDGLRGAFDFVPLGPTVPEMAAIMGGLGARNAVLLDGGISSQLLIRDRPVRRWRGLRGVPMGLLVTARP